MKKLFSFSFLGNRLAACVVGLFFCFGASGQAHLMTNTVIEYNATTNYVKWRWQTECSPTPDTLDNIFLADYFLFAYTRDTLSAKAISEKVTTFLIEHQTAVNEVDEAMRIQLFGCNLTEYAFFCAVLQRRTTVVKTN